MHFSTLSVVSLLFLAASAVAYPSGPAGSVGQPSGGSAQTVLSATPQQLTPLDAETCRAFLALAKEAGIATKPLKGPSSHYVRPAHEDLLTHNLEKAFYHKDKAENHLKSAEQDQLYAKVFKRCHYEKLASKMETDTLYHLSRAQYHAGRTEHHANDLELPAKPPAATPATRRR